MCGDFWAGVDDALAGSMSSKVYAIAGGVTSPITKLEVQLTVSKTYVNITGDWTLARAVVTNVGAFPAYSVWVLFHTPDGTEQAIFYKQIRPSHSQTVTWNLTSGNGLPTVKSAPTPQISYRIAVEDRAVNGPTELAEVALTVDPPVESQYTPTLSEGIFWVPVSICGGTGFL